ncbi:hypothetical protein [Oleomonas cavernae]|uniref:hypothetical protein n=1 Tax=Oleomonas cavernae TaxID=2320859 RepID=UPI0011C3E9AB|nr:hypothetical protein [Oleomonas cavernae]
MTVSYIYNGQPMTGTANDDFVIAYKGSTGTDNNTVNAGSGDDWVMGDSSDTWIPNASYLNGSIATAFNLETLTSTWTPRKIRCLATAAFPIPRRSSNRRSARANSSGSRSARARRSGSTSTLPATRRSAPRATWSWNCRAPAALSC